MDDDLFCFRCGKYLRICSSCNFEIPRDVSIEAKYCLKCGYLLFEPIPPLKIVKEIKWNVGDVFKVFILSILSNLLLILLVLLLSFVFTFFIKTFETVFLFVTLSSFHLLLLIFTTYYVRKRGGSFREMGVKSITTKFIMMGILLGITLPLLTTVLSLLTEPIIGSSPIQEELMKTVKTPSLFPIFLFLGSIIAPVIEEIYFRGFSYQAFKKKWGANWGTFVNAIFFALLHLDPWVFLHILVIGIVLAYAYEKTGSLPLVMIAHSLNNALAFLI